MQVFNPTNDMLLQAGYKQIIESPIPEDPPPSGQHYEAYYTDSGETITQIWELVNDDPYPSGKSLEQRVTDLEADVSVISSAIERGLTT